MPPIMLTAVIVSDDFTLIGIANDIPGLTSASAMVARSTLLIRGSGAAVARGMYPIRSVGFAY